MTAAVLDPADADRLAKLLGMLGSHHDGERAAAGAKADQLVRALGLTWHQVITVTVAPPLSPATRPPPRRMAVYCHARRWQLSAKEREFVESMLQWRGEPTERQREWLTDLYARLSARAAA